MKKGVIIATLHFIILTTLSLIKYENLQYCSLDLGIFTQSLSSILHGMFLYNTVEFQMYGASTHFAVHFQPILLLIFPLFAVFKSPITLLILQSFALAISVLIAYLIAMEVNEEIALPVTILYACNSSLIGIGLFEFHPVSLAVPLLLLSFLALLKRESKLFYVTSALTLSVKEDAFLGILGILAWDTLKNGVSRRKIIEVLCVLFYGILVIKVVIPLFGGRYIYESLYKSINIDQRKLLYFITVNATFSFLPFLDYESVILLFLPWLESLLSSRPTQTMIGFHYSYMIVPLSFIASVYGAKKLNKRALGGLVVAGILVSLATLPITFSPNKEDLSVVHYARLHQYPRKNAFWELIKLVNGSVYTQPRFYAPLSTKIDVYVYPRGAKVEYILLDMTTYRGRIWLKRFGRINKVRVKVIKCINGVCLFRVQK
ncbi:hypothetical protein A3L04_05825 [Thermococcus chitonophagus]|uniref:DUF2079 domain-containing protein n=1 Tax=Thermococcus chitonophagus TaxID=54262 RepID=A0A160VRB6_9EURY|nr:DUF2079 domain-containing protein [Thermococcus chitonophagus]ASJ16621.1 hypothetical protein A3L04_05825 [Thermococcus chitonophagus]CUX77455.1 hypothetical protein CHITON_0676 [Thermococcus chitonophagus]